MYIHSIQYIYIYIYLTVAQFWAMAGSDDEDDRWGNWPRKPPKVPKPPPYPPPHVQQVPKPPPVVPMAPGPGRGVHVPPPRHVWMGRQVPATPPKSPGAGKRKAEDNRNKVPEKTLVKRKPNSKEPAAVKKAVATTPKEQPVKKAVATTPKEQPVKKAAATTSKEQPVKKAAATTSKEEPVKKAAATTSKEEPVKKAAATTSKDEPVKKAAATTSKEEPVKKAAATTSKETAVKGAFAENAILWPAWKLGPVWRKSCAVTERKPRFLFFLWNWGQLHSYRNPRSHRPIQLPRCHLRVLFMYDMLCKYIYIYIHTYIVSSTYIYIYIYMCVYIHIAGSSTPRGTLQAISHIPAIRVVLQDSLNLESKELTKQVLHHLGVVGADAILKPLSFSRGPRSVRISIKHNFTHASHRNRARSPGKSCQLLSSRRWSWAVWASAYTLGWIFKYGIHMKVQKCRKTLISASLWWFKSIRRRR